VIGRYTVRLDRRYYYTDHLGSTRAVVDGNGTVLETRDYYPYGLRMPGRTLADATNAKEDYTGHACAELDSVNATRRPACTTPGRATT